MSDSTEIEPSRPLLVRGFTGFALALAALLSVTTSILVALVVAASALAVLGSGRLKGHPEQTTGWLAVAEFACWLAGVFVVVIVGEVWLAVPLLALAFASESYWRSKDRARTGWNTARAVAAVVFAVVELVLASFVSVAVALCVGMVVQMARTHRATARYGRRGTWIVLSNKFAFMVVAFVAVQAALLSDMKDITKRLGCDVEELGRIGDQLGRRPVG